MEIRNDLRVINPTFGAINYEAARYTMTKVFSMKELSEFRNIAEKSKANNLVDIILFGNGKKLDAANIADRIYLKGDWKCKYYKPRFFESNMHFIKRMVQKMEKRTQKVREILEKQNFDL